MTQKYPVAILAVGTELTSGQILNRNAQWISNRLRSLGLPTDVHLSVPDDRKAISEALDFVSKTAKIIFVTGGLGPTSDDFTREVIAEWVNLPLEFDEASWTQIVERLQSRGIPIRPSQRQQCFFPKSAEILVNPLGTANAFLVESRGIHIYVLPGPPREIEGIWNSGIAPSMEKIALQVDPLVTFSWDTMGLGESEVAHLAEEALHGCPFEIGYRFHLPYVEVKLTYPLSASSEAQAWTLRLEEALGGFTMVRNGEDLAERLCRHLSGFKKIRLVDEVSGVHALNRLFPHARALLAERKLDFVSARSEAEAKARRSGGGEGVDAEVLSLALYRVSPGWVRAELSLGPHRRIQDFSSPYSSPLMRDREGQFFSEMALAFWCQELSQRI